MKDQQPDGASATDAIAKLHIQLKRQQKKIDDLSQLVMSAHQSDEVIIEQSIAQGRGLRKRMDELTKRVVSLENRLRTAESGLGAKVAALRKSVGYLNKAIVYVSEEATRSFRQLAFRDAPNAKHEVNYDAAYDGCAAGPDASLSLSGKVICVVAPAYPTKDGSYGGEFIRQRVLAYKRAGAKIYVFEHRGAEDNRSISKRNIDGVGVFTGGTLAFSRFIASNDHSIDVYCVHFMSPSLYGVLKAKVDLSRIIVWLHGFEARDYKRLLFNFSEADLAKNGGFLEDLNFQRRSLMREILPNARLRKVFISNFLREIVQQDTGVEAVSYFVIPNLIDGGFFQKQNQTADKRFKLLWIRSFDAHNYANDLARDFLLRLSETAYWDQISCSVFGDGKHFDQILKPLRGFRNVEIEKGYLTADQVVSEHQKAGIMLAPTRFDTQGVTVCEAMSSGLVPITNRVASIPEFVTPESAVLAPSEDVSAMVRGFIELAESEELFFNKVDEAARLVRQKCDVQFTVNREIEIIAEGASKEI